MEMLKDFVALNWIDFHRLLIAGAAVVTVQFLGTKAVSFAWFLFVVLNELTSVPTLSHKNIFAICRCMQQSEVALTRPGL